MKTKLLLMAALISAATLSANAGIHFGFSFNMPLPVVVVAPAAPVVVASPDVEVPDSYVWDGVEYVGIVGDQYFYLSPDNVWVACDPFRVGRFHDWERFHPDWRAHDAIHNDHFRAAAHGHMQPIGHSGYARPVHSAPKQGSATRKK